MFDQTNKDFKNLGYGVIMLENPETTTVSQPSKIELSCSPETLPWFPRKIADLDLIRRKVSCLNSFFVLLF